MIIDVKADSHGELGLRIGRATKDAVRGCLAQSADFERCRSFLDGRRDVVDGMLARTRERFPGLAEELEGMAAGLEMPFIDLFAYNCRSEILLALGIGGCSTVGVKAGGRVMLAHNEDGDPSNMGRLFVARVVPPSGVAFMALTYPGLLPGNGPGVNRLGLVQTTNYIRPRAVREGVPCKKVHPD